MLLVWGTHFVNQGLSQLAPNDSAVSFRVGGAVVTALPESPSPIKGNHWTE